MEMKVGNHEVDLVKLTIYGRGQKQKKVYWNVVYLCVFSFLVEILLKVLNVYFMFWVEGDKF